MKSTYKSKSTYTPDEWSSHLEKARQRRLNNIDKERERLRLYNARPEVKERRRVHDAKHEVAKKRREYALSPAGKAWAKEAHKKLRANSAEWESKLELQRKYRTGFSGDLIKTLIQHQNNKCAICGNNFDNPKNIKADHNHTTHEPRGLLCHKCNIIEGMITKMGFTPFEYANRLHDYLSYTPVSSLNAK